MKIFVRSIIEFGNGSMAHLRLKGKKWNTLPIGILNVGDRALVQGFIHNPAR